MWVYDAAGAGGTGSKSTVRVATVKLQGQPPPTLTLFIVLCFSCSLLLFPSFSSHHETISPPRSKSFPTSEQSSDKHFQTPAVWSQGHFFSVTPCLLPRLLQTHSLSQGNLMRPNFLLRNLIRAMTLFLHTCPPSYSRSFLHKVCLVPLFVCEPGNVQTNVCENELHASTHYQLSGTGNILQPHIVDHIISHHIVHKIYNILHSSEFIMIQISRETTEIYFF